MVQRRNIIKPQILFLGAGAIGRGYLPWIFPDNEYDFLFIDSNKEIVETMNSQGYATSFMAKDDQLKKKQYKVEKAFLPHEFTPEKFPNIKVVYVSVGPRNCVSAVKQLEGLDCPIVLCENDPSLVEKIKKSSSLKKVYFGVPDVITSNSSPDEQKKQDSLSVITENGVMFVDENASSDDILGDITYISENELLEKQWTAKLYIHNTPHCIAAYLGSLVGAKYLHEAMAYPEINTIVEGVMEEMLNSLKLEWSIPHDFLDWYAEKELSRFRNTLLSDPIARVAREPLRKLELHGRLIGAANICISMGFIPENILIGIVAAIHYRENNDNDSHLDFIKENLTDKQLLTHILKLRDGEALERVLLRRMPSLHQKIIEIINLNHRENK